MNEVRAALVSGAITGPPATLPNGQSVETDTYTMQSGSGDSQDRLCLKVTAEGGLVLCSVEGPQDEPLTREYFIRWLDGMLGVWRSRREGQQK